MRLQFLTCVFSTLGSPDHFSKKFWISTLAFKSFEMPKAEAAGCSCIVTPRSPRAESGAGGHIVALPGGGRRVLRRRAALVPQPGAQQRPARHGHGNLQAPLPGEGGDKTENMGQNFISVFLSCI